MFLAGNQLRSRGYPGFASSHGKGVEEGRPLPGICEVQHSPGSYDEPRGRKDGLLRGSGPGQRDRTAMGVCDRYPVYTIQSTKEDTTVHSLAKSAMTI